MRVLSYSDLNAKGIRFSRQWIHQLVLAGKFPKPIKLGEATTGFVESEVDQWIAERIRERDKAPREIRP
jgi:prophage regulatory protein